MPSEVRAVERSWLLLAQTASCPAELAAGIQRSSVVAVVDKARTPAAASVGRSAASMRCPPIPICRPGSGYPAVRCPARPVSGHLGRRPGGPAVRPSAVHPSSVQPSGVHPSGVQPPGVRPVRTRPSGPTSGGGGGDQVEAAGQPSPPERGEVPMGGHAVERSVDGRGGLAGDAAELARRSVGSRWGTRARLGKAAAPRDR